MKTLREYKFNGKIYGKSGSYSIYVNNQKIEVSDEQVAEYKTYESEYENLKKNFPSILNSREVEIKATELGIAKPFYERTLEQLKAHLQAFKVRTVKEFTVQNIKGKLIECTNEGNFIIAEVSYENGKSMYLNQTQFEKAIKDLEKIKL